MSGFMETVRARRSIRRYDGRRVPPEAIAGLQEAVLRAPSSRGLRPWRFAFVTDRAKLDELSRCKPQYGEFLADASLGVVVAADEALTDMWVEDCSIAATILQLTATSLGLGSCWIQVRGRDHGDGTSAEEYVREVVGLEEGLRVECILSIGFPAEEKPPLPAERLKREAITEL